MWLRLKMTLMVIFFSTSFFTNFIGLPFLRSVKFFSLSKFFNLLFRFFFFLYLLLVTSTTILPKCVLLLFNHVSLTATSSNQNKLKYFKYWLISKKIWKMNKKTLHWWLLIYFWMFNVCDIWIKTSTNQTKFLIRHSKQRESFKTKNSLVMYECDLNTSWTLVDISVSVLMTFKILCTCYNGWKKIVGCCFLLLFSEKQKIIKTRTQFQSKIVKND